MENKDMSRRTLLTVAGATGLGVLAAEAAAAQAQKEQATQKGDAQEGRGEGTQGSRAGSTTGHPFAEVTQEVKKNEVRQLLKGGDGASPAELAGSGFTYRHDWGNLRGQQTLRLNWASVNARSRVFVAIGEGAAGGPDGGKFIGSARYTLHNVAPRAGGVDIWVNIEWSSNIRIYVDYLVVNA